MGNKTSHEGRYPVNTVDKAYAACNPGEPLMAGDSRYVDLLEARGTVRLPDIIARRIGMSEGFYHRQLVTGHRGSGKSTELRKLQGKLEKEGFFVVYLDVETTLNLGEIEFLDVLLAIARELQQSLEYANLEIDDGFLKEIEAWFDTKVVTTSKLRDVQSKAAAKAEAGGGVPGLGRILASIMTEIRSGSSVRDDIRREVEKNLGQFRIYFDSFLNFARLAAVAKGYEDIVIIVDGLEKMHLREEDSDGFRQTNHYKLFVANAEFLKAPKAHLIYTVPIWLAFYANLGDAFDAAAFVIPMVKYKTPIGRQCLREVLAKRFVLNEVLENEALADKLIDMSGGAVRDLLRLVRIACDTVEDGVIRDKDVAYAVKTLIQEYDRLVNDEYISLLHKVKLEKVIPSMEECKDVLHRRMVHEFQNDERWAELHPAVEYVLNIRKKRAMNSDEYE